MIKRIIAAGLGVALMLSVAGCSREKPLTADQARMPASSDDFIDEDFQDVADSLTGAGFTNVETKAMGDLIAGWLSSPGEVEEVEIGGVASFDKASVFERGVSIVVSYHSFPEDDEDQPAESAAPSAEPSVSPSADAEIMTVENNADLAAFLAITDNCSDVNSDFAAKYEGRIIEFDGNISAMQHHGDYDTRYDFLLAPGDYSETKIVGPSFQFRDVNATYDLHLTGSNGKDTIGVGDQIRITAEVDFFDSLPCQFILEPVATAFR
ncbi:hypothetical protein RCH23_001381 [Cryobacterium sp. CAN_C3]|uniref:DUF4839 domain-containing protein n=1 Tax=unclassified Cryobacterium TaxID=2649013 RepID=UPI0018CA5994|nr:DUF4839 domain-containing protein [Cryobacterium sp. CAN_C3]MEC5154007.1 hypothetical protein [Cryobacterium sp. CAN_C3]